MPGATALADICRDAEAIGADALWAVDHLFWPRPVLECLTTLAVAATATRRATLGSCVLQLPLRQPSAVAKEAASLQLLSGGRFVLGLGIGSHPGEYAMAGVDFTRRGQLLDEGIRTLRRDWATSDDPECAYHQSPRPADPPIWLGGSSAAARRRTARVGDGWVPLFIRPDEYAEALGHLRTEALAAGRDPYEITASVVAFVHIGPEAESRQRGTRWLSSLYGIPPKSFDRHLIAGSPAACAEQIQRYVEAGADHVAVMVADDHPLSHFADLVGALAPAVPGDPVPPSRPDLVEVPA